MQEKMAETSIFQSVMKYIKIFLMSKMVRLQGYVRKFQSGMNTA
jgi:hypothetical protein